MRSLLMFVFAAATTLMATSAHAQWDPEARRHIEEEANQNDMRARELEPIIQRYTAARNEVTADIIQLQTQATNMRNRANWYRQWALRPNVWHREHFERSARELDEYARHNDDVANQSRLSADGLQRLVVELSKMRDMHRAMAGRMRESLAWH